MRKITLFYQQDSSKANNYYKNKKKKKIQIKQKQNTMPGFCLDEQGSHVSHFPPLITIHAY